MLVAAHSLQPPLRIARKRNNLEKVRNYGLYVRNWCNNLNQFFFLYVCVKKNLVKESKHVSKAVIILSDKVMGLF